MPTFRSTFGYFSPIAATATLSVFVLVSVSSYQLYRAMYPEAPQTPTDGNSERIADMPGEWQDELAKLGITDEALGLGSATSTDTTALIGPVIASQILTSYEDIRAQGEYTQEDLQRAAQDIATYMKAGVEYKKRAAADFVTDNDSSTERVRAYRTELLAALSPLNTIGSAEYEIYGRYVATGDATYLAELSQAAELYSAVSASAASIVVPKEALAYHTDTVNALEAFGAVLRELSTHADDPFASVALLRTYNEKEAGISQAYQNLRAYYGNKAL